MNKKIQRHTLLLVGLLLACFSLQAQDNVSYKNGFLANKPKKMLIDLKAGRGFLSSTESEDDARVFYGGGNVSFGLLLNGSFVGLGAGGEYVDMKEGSFDFPVFVNYQYYFSRETGKGFFAGAKLGYIFGGKKSIPIQTTVHEEVIDGAIERSMKGLYGEVDAGYCFSGFNLFVSYNYRVIGYETIWAANNFGLTNSTYSRTMHMVMVGISFMVF